MKNSLLILSTCISLLILGNIFGTLSDEQIISGWTIFHPLILLSVFGVLLGHGMLYKSKATLDTLLLILSVLYFFIGLISTFLEYSVIHYRGYPLMGYNLGIFLIALSIFLITMLHIEKRYR